MKKILFAAMGLFTALASFSQGNIHQGDWMVGGDAAFSYSKQGEDKVTTVAFVPNVGYFFINNFVGGLRANLSSVKTEIGTVKTTVTATSLAPFVRYYFLPASQKVNIFVDGDFEFGQYKTKDGTEDKLKFTGFDFKAGPSFFLTPSSALELAFGYSSRKYKDVSERDNIFNISLGFQVHLPGMHVKK